MDESIIEIIENANILMQKALEHLDHEFSKIRAGKASPSMVAELKVNYYGTPTAMGQVANVSAADSRTLVIQPWEKKMLAEIERSIFEANLGVTPMNDGETVRLSIPPLTEERRKDLVKQAKAMLEDAKISIRNDRQKVISGIKKAVKDGYPEDQGKRDESSFEVNVKTFIDKAEKAFSIKEQSILHV